jgi:VCBS repeat-containing protein
MFFTAPKNRFNGKKTNTPWSPPAPDHLMLALEPRLLFDAAGLIAGLDLLPDPNAPGPDHSGVDNTSPDSPDPDNPDLDIPDFDNLGPEPGRDTPFFAAPPATDTPTTSLVFIDPGVTGYDSLVKDLPGDTRVVILSDQSDGIRQIRDILAEYQGIQSVHIISHGTSGSITLGDAVLSNDTLDTHAPTLGEWTDSLAPGADILVYGCDVAQGTQGQAFVAQLSDITGADVAASDDITGAAAKGGDWELETRTGTIESGLAVSLQAQSRYTGILADYTVTQAGDSQNVAVDGINTKDGLNLREAISLAETNGEADTITFKSDMTGTHLLNYGALAITKAEGVTINGDIDGDGTFDITIDANKTSQVFKIDTNAVATLTGLSITKGAVAGYGTGIYNKGNLTLSRSKVSDNFSVYGGGIWNSGILNISNSTISDNYAYFGGGIWNIGTLSIEQNSTISGNYAYVSGGGILNYTATANLTIDNSTISDNYAYVGGGGGIFNAYYSNLTITDSTISNNTAPYLGGGIANVYSSLTITDSTISGNTADEGAGSYNYGSDVTIQNSSISGNIATYDGGGILNVDTDLTITNSTISFNRADNYHGGGILNDNQTGEVTTITNSTLYHNQAIICGGGIYNANGALKISNSTISTNNTQAYGGGICNMSDLYLYHSTLSGNTALSGAGIYSSPDDKGNPSKVFMGHTIVNDGLTLYKGSQINSQGYNLFAQASVAGSDPSSDLLEANADLQPLASNGGPTLTHALGSGSDALNAGDPSAIAGMGTVPVNDQRGPGYARIINTIDIGAVEMPNTPPTAIADNFITNQAVAITTGNVLINDSDPDAGDALRVIDMDTTGTKGVVTNNGNGTFGYDPNGKFDYLAVGATAIDTFTYTISDNNGATDTAVVTITVSGIATPVIPIPIPIPDPNINARPVGGDDNFTTTKGTAITTTNVLLNDTDADRGTFLGIVGLNTKETLGIITSNGDGTFNYDPNGQFDFLAKGETAIDTFTYALFDGKQRDIVTVTITITGSSNLPSTNLFSFSANKETPATGTSVPFNGIAPDSGRTLTVTGMDTTGTMASIPYNGKSNGSHFFINYPNRPPGENYQPEGDPIMGAHDADPNGNGHLDARPQVLPKTISSQGFNEQLQTAAARFETKRMQFLRSLRSGTVQPDDIPI